MRLILGYAMVLASQLILYRIVYDVRYFVISVLFMIGYALIFWNKGEAENDRVGNEKDKGDREGE